MWTTSERCCGVGRSIATLGSLGLVSADQKVPDRVLGYLRRSQSSAKPVVVRSLVLRCLMRVWAEGLETERRS